MCFNEKFRQLYGKNFTLCFHSFVCFNISSLFAYLLYYTFLLQRNIIREILSLLYFLELKHVKQNQRWHEAQRFVQQKTKSRYIMFL